MFLAACRNSCPTTAVFYSDLRSNHGFECLIEPMSCKHILVPHWVSVSYSKVSYCSCQNSCPTTAVFYSDVRSNHGFECLIEPMDSHMSPLMSCKYILASKTTVFYINLTSKSKFSSLSLTCPCVVSCSLLFCDVPLRATHAKQRESDAD